ncbi:MULTISPECIES: head-tail connector protein [Pseudomonadati]|uniref:Uncharacterized protein n=2 Tax=Pseudomonadati TaxID=3379134 RepID=A0A7K0GMM8_PARDI|nr:MULTISPECIES: hypothetical protein [Bacteria]KAB5324040.1 hypothetical protein F9951_16770 [Bacteroides stercoris]MRY60419.1 hypothetical protein [Parabacteroides distasonis]MSA33689.1 hypothetical protein [Parabacteroides distasonis]MSA77407.1 hypothetical protein [Parabacteroides distasonis]MTU16831.1 hypothetical protein [Parasutterella excrementihominis]
MPYITKDDFKDLLEVDEKFLEKSIKKTEQLFEVVTRRFYTKHDFETDVEWRKKAVRDALKAQVEFFINHGATTAQELNSEPITVTLGRTSISNATRNQSTLANAKATSNLLCDEFYLLLFGTGLLYRGIGHG